MKWKAKWINMSTKIISGSLPLSPSFPLCCRRNWNRWISTEMSINFKWLVWVVRQRMEEKSKTKWNGFVNPIDLFNDEFFSFLSSIPWTILPRERKKIHIWNHKHIRTFYYLFILFSRICQHFFSELIVQSIQIPNVRCSILIWSIHMNQHSISMDNGTKSI